ncbi:MAG: DUF4249 domain-containing protein [Muribaculaceae bacterium]|nr:DUF4249 domain-containing protein [Muribaculaceae bacterium]
MKHLIYLLLLLGILVPAGCEQRDEPTLNPADIPLVVEGWIEEGKAPVVMVTHAANLTGNVPSLDSLIEKWCRVIIYDNDVPYILTSRKNDAYLPPIIFTSTRLKGKPGHTYRLTVETDDRTVSATAFMLPAPELDSVRVVPVEGNDSLFSLRAYLHNPERGTYYKYFLKTIPGEQRSYPAFMGNVSADSYNPAEGTSLTRGRRAALNDSTSSEFLHYFKKGDRVLVTCASLEPEIYDLWRVYDANVSFSDNIFFTFTSNLPSNIEGGLGYFAAYGTTEKAVIVR